MNYVTESGDQQTLIDWCQTQVALGLYPELAYLTAIPNGGKRDKRTAAKMVAEGAHAGALDLVLPVARRGAHSFWLEMKIKGGRLSDMQRDYIGFLSRNGHKVVVAYSFEEARDALMEYLAK